MCLCDSQWPHSDAAPRIRFTFSSNSLHTPKLCSPKNIFSSLTNMFSFPHKYRKKQHLGLNGQQIESSHSTALWDQKPPTAVQETCSVLRAVTFISPIWWSIQRTHNERTWNQWHFLSFCQLFHNGFWKGIFLPFCSPHDTTVVRLVVIGVPTKKSDVNTM